ncbi:MAG: hypothetical protein AAFY31_18145, partial [Pseudomonadota bacterium]
MLIAKDGESEKAIPKTLFNAVDYWVDISNSNLGRGDEVVFRALTLQCPVHKGETADPSADAKPEPAAVPADPSATAKNKGTNHGKHLYHVALDRVLCKWLDEGEPDSKKELVRWMEKAFRDEKAQVPDECLIRKWLQKKHRVFMPRQSREANGGKVGF